MQENIAKICWYQQLVPIYLYLFAVLSFDERVAKKKWWDTTKIMLSIRLQNMSNKAASKMNKQNKAVPIKM